VLDGRDWRPGFDAEETRRELQIIRDDLHCNAVKLQGQDLARLDAAAAHALDLGLEVWLAPEMWERPADETLEHLGDAAGRAERLRREYPNRVVLSVGSEITLFMPGFLDGDTFDERLAFAWQIRSDACRKRLNDYLGRAADLARSAFGGPITYASLPSELVDWTSFDVIGVDLYRDGSNRDRFSTIARRFCSMGKPFVAMETGCCTYRGAEDRGGSGYDIVDHTDPTRPHVINGYVRDETAQAEEVADLLAVFDAAVADGVFVQTFIQPCTPSNADPRFDFDTASYSLVRSFATRCGELTARFPDIRWDTVSAGTTYPDMPWEPKESFHAVAGFYATH
ncbi:MAG TPA: hypothetical protein VMA77_13455, partial [Solirubrobacteraceae bacterium]|nr:hypothetical protein [Solirubrobacteraceae bacterium]